MASHQATSRTLISIMPATLVGLGIRALFGTWTGPQSS
jgi:hypothetical protein